MCWVIPLQSFTELVISNKLLHNVQGINRSASLIRLMPNVVALVVHQMGVVSIVALEQFSKG